MAKEAPKLRTEEEFLAALRGETSAEFERLCTVLDHAEDLPRPQAYIMLRKAVVELNPADALARWFVERVTHLTIQEEDGA